MFLYKSVTPKMLYETSRDYLIKINPKDKPYDIFVTNNTILDRTYNNSFVDDDDRQYKSIAHCIACRKLKLWGVSQKMLDDCYENFEIESPMAREFQYCDFETVLCAKYYKEIDLLPETVRYSWRENYVQIAAEVIMTAISQNKSMKQTLMGTGNKVICEVSGSTAWGTDCDDKFLKLAFPKHWEGENGYGQALMIVRQSMN